MIPILINDFIITYNLNTFTKTAHFVLFFRHTSYK